MESATGLYRPLENDAFLKACDKLADYYSVDNRILDYAKRRSMNSPKVIMQSHDEEITLREMDGKFEHTINVIAEKLMKELPPESGKAILEDTLVSHDYSALYTIMGWYWSEPGLFPINNKNLVKRENFTENEISEFKSLVHRYYSGYKSCHARIKKDSSAGIVFHTNDLLLKKKAIYNFFNNAEAIHEKAKNKDIHGLLDLGVCNWFLLGERLQPDSVAEFEFTSDGPKIKPKERYVNIGNKKISPSRTVPGYEDSRQAVRVRKIFGGSATLNLAYSIITSPMNEYALNHDKELSRTFHHTTNWEDKIEGYEHVVGFDFSQFDMTIPSKLITSFFEALDDVLPYPYNMTRFLFPHAPVVSPPSGVAKVGDKIQPELVANRNPLTYDYEDESYSGGNQSGQFAVAVVAKVVAIFQVFLILRDLGLVSSIDEVFSSDQFVVLNMGDDTMIAFKDKIYADKVENIINSNDHKSLIFDVELEKPITFLGHVLAGIDGKRKFIPDITSYVVKFLRPEHHYHWKMMPRHGYYDRKDYYNEHPYFEKVEDIVQSTFKDIWGRTLDEIVGEEEDIDFDFEPTYENLVFLETNGDAIFYKIDADDVDPDLLDMYFLTYHPDDIDDILGIPHGYQGRIFGKDDFNFGKSSISQYLRA